MGLFHLAEVDFIVHCPADVVDIVVKHGEGDACGEDGHDGEDHRRVGDEPIGLERAEDTVGHKKNGTLIRCSNSMMVEMR